MDMRDIDREFEELKRRPIKPKKRVDHSVKHAGLKVVTSKLVAALFVLAVALFAFYTFTSARSANLNVALIGAISVVYLALGIYIAYKLWHIEFVGWLALLFVSLAGIAIPVMSAISNGMAAGTIPIVAVSIIALAILWWIRDLYRVKKVRDIFRPA